jgi:hypothetical protein
MSVFNLLAYSCAKTGALRIVLYSAFVDATAWVDKVVPFVVASFAEVCLPPAEETCNTTTKAAFEGNPIRAMHRAVGDRIALLWLTGGAQWDFCIFRGGGLTLFSLGASVVRSRFHFFVLHILRLALITTCEEGFATLAALVEEKVVQSKCLRPPVKSAARSHQLGVGL